MSDIKIIAKYLPQFHRTLENDEWWGEGFTEWTAVRNAEPLYDGHKQPKKPMNDNYYDLMDKKTMKWQANLMHVYGVDGMCFYHYWFKDGRKILEKPAENLLRWTDINMPFCFCWANESWIRTWSNAGNGNAWVMNDGRKISLDDDGVLLEQKYGGEKEWKEHFEYLLPFFKDKRYIKHAGKPVFLIYKPLSMPQVFNMIKYWRKLAADAGIGDIYFIGENLDKKYTFDARLLGEPAYVFHKYFEGQRVIRYEDAINAEILDKPQDDTYYGAFSGFDNTPRMGIRGNIVKEASPSLFKKQVLALIRKNFDSGMDMLFVNAWNEWGEGMYLEPDEESGFNYLKALKEAKDNCDTDDIPSGAPLLKVYNDPNAAILNKYDKFWHILDRWMKLKEAGKNLSPYFKIREINEVAVYGCGMLGRHLIKELERTGIKISFLIDQNAEKIESIYDSFTSDMDFPHTEAIIVTIPDAYPSIYMKLREKTEVPVISVEEVVMEVSS